MNSPGDKKFYLLPREATTRPNSRDTRLKRQQKFNNSVLKSSIPSPNLYDHVKSKVFDAIDAPNIVVKQCYKSTKKEAGSLIQKLSAAYLVEAQVSEGATLPCKKIEGDPIFFNVSNLIFKTDDVYNLYLTSKNAENYECLLYRNNIFSNVNPKRNVLFNKRFSASELDWNFKK